MAFRGQCPKEELEQVTFVNRVRAAYPETWGRLIMHVKNEGKRTQAQYDRDAMNGLNPGAADILIIGRIPFVCELKRRDHTKSRLQPGQEEFLELAAGAGCFAFVALGADAAWESFNEWLKLVE